jgi:hypothetical protein
MKFFELIKESRVDDFKSKYGKKFNEEQLNKIIDNVPQKFLDWVGKNFDTINFNQNFLDLVTKLREFEKISSNLPKTDINSYKSLEDIYKALNDYSTRQRRDYKQVEGGKVVFDDGRFFVVNPQTHQSSCHYGKGTKWCTVASSDHQFNQYNSDGKLFYILDRNADSSDPFYKVALLNKFDGNKSFFTATDEQTNIYPAHVGTGKYNEIMNQITEYMNSEYSEQIKIFSDKEVAKKEKERQEALRLARILNERREEADERRVENEWALGPDCPEEGLKAHALLEWLSDNNDVEVKTREDMVEIDRLKGEIQRLQTQYDESEDVETDLLDEISDLEDELQELENKIDVYNIIPTGEFYDCTEFEVIDAGIDDRRYAVGTENEMQSSCEERVDSLIDDIGYEGFSSGFARGYIDEDEVADYARDYLGDDVYQNPEVYFDESERQLSKKQEEDIAIYKMRIEKTKKEIERLEEIMDDENEEEIQSKVDELNDLMTEYEDEIESIQDDPDGEFPDDLIEEKVDELADDVRRDPESFLNEHGIDWEQFIDKDNFIQGVIDADGFGHTLNSYDGNADETKIQDQWFYVMRID